MLGQLLCPFEFCREELGVSKDADGSFGSVSYGGFVVMFMNGPIAWASRKIKVQVTSSTEAEICAGVGALKEAKFIRHVLGFLDEPVVGPTPLIIDSDGMWFHTRNSGVSSLTKHYEKWQNFLRYAFMHRVMSVHKTDGKTGERADILTKPIPKEGIEMYKYFRNLILNVSGKEASDD